jgi:hypothetical protein
MFQVEKVINTQLALMKVEQQASSRDTATSNLAQPGPSGLSGRASTAEHGVPGKF